MKEDFQALLRDIHFFIQEYHTPTTLSALQVYHSGLVSMPKCALTHQAPDAKIVQLVMGRDDGWAGELVLEGHMSSVTSAVFSPDGLRIVSGSMDYCVRMWDAISGMHKGTMTDHTEPVMSVDFSSDGLHILSCSENGTVLVWDNMRGVSKRPGIGRSYWETIKAVSHDGLLAAGTLPDEDGKIYVWNTAESRSRYTLSLDAEISSIAFSFDDLRMASGCSVGTIHIWNVITGSKQLMLHGHTHWVGSLAFSRDGLKLVSGSHDCTVRVWDAISGTHQFAFTGHTNSILSVEFSPNSAQIVSGSADTTVRVWDAKMSLGTQQHRAPKARLTPAEVKFLPGGLHIIEWHSADNCMRLWDAVSGMLQHTLTSASDDGIWCISCSSDGLKIASGSNFDGTVRVWSVISGACLLTLNGHTSSASAVNFSSDNSKIVSGSWDHSVRVWDAVSGILLQTLDGHPAPIIEAVFSDDGQLVISDSIQGTRYVWETATGRLWEKSQHTPPTLQFPISHPSTCPLRPHRLRR
jgi:WD40 repeat protein